MIYLTNLLKYNLIMFGDKSYKARNFKFSQIVIPQFSEDRYNGPLDSMNMQRKAAQFMSS